VKGEVRGKGGMEREKRDAKDARKEAGKKGRKWGKDYGRN
jgi:hypothetical protein